MTHAYLLVAAMILAAQPEKQGLGLIMPSPVQYKRLVEAGADFKSFAKGFKGITPPRVDLTDRFPKPEPKGQGDAGACVGWAVAYGAKSCQEAIENQWSADVDSRRFSPSFVYNQRANRPDPGMRIEDAIAILLRSGCATWERMPYQPKDDGDPPDDAVVDDAAPYQISGFMAIDPCSTDFLKLALANNYTIVIGINVAKNFFKIRKGEVYREYDPEEIRRAHENKEGTGHAICIVGYDDDLRAFRLMNSWGNEWADDGYCWVGYEVFDLVAPWDVRFCKMAFALFDAPTVRLETKVQPSGEVAGKPSYAWEVAATASPQTMKDLTSITYKLTGGFQPATVKRDDATSRFALTSADLSPSTSAVPVAIEVQIATKSGTHLRRMVTVPCGLNPSGTRPATRVTAGQVTLPDLRGRTSAEAALRLIGLGLKPRIQRNRDEASPSGAPGGRVARQSPEASETVPKGSTVILYLERP